MTINTELNQCKSEYKKTVHYQQNRKCLIPFRLNEQINNYQFAIIQFPVIIESKQQSIYIYIFVYVIVLYAFVLVYNNNKVIRQVLATCCTETGEQPSCVNGYYTLSLVANSLNWPPYILHGCIQLRPQFYLFPPHTTLSPVTCNLLQSPPSPPPPHLSPLNFIIADACHLKEICQ